MSIKLHWFLPTSGDSRSLVGAGQGVPGEVRGGPKETLSPGFREPTIDYLADVARTAEKLGFEGVLTPTGTFCEDAWLTTAALLRETSRLKFLVAFRPGVINPVLAAQMAAAYQRISDGRLMINIVTGGEPREQARFGDTASKAERYAKTEEFLAVMRGTWNQAPFDFSGKYFEVEGAQVSGGITPTPHIYFGGSSGPAGPVAAKHADVYLTWGEPLELVREKVRDGRRTPPRASSRWPRTCGRAWAWSVVVPVRRWSAATRRWPTGSRSTTASASTSSSCPATRTSRRRTGSARA
jgi:alkanesulfonate monooxygenase